MANLPPAGMLEGWAAHQSPRRSAESRSGSGLTLSTRELRTYERPGKTLRTSPHPANDSPRRSARWSPPTLPPGRRLPIASALSASQPRRTSVLRCSMSELQRPEATTKASTSGKQHATGPPPQPQRSEQNGPNHCCTVSRSGPDGEGKATHRVLQHTGVKRRPVGCAQRQPATLWGLAVLPRPGSGLLVRAFGGGSVCGAQLVACFVFEQGYGQEFPVGGPEAVQGPAVGPADDIG
jgi:hypothetical protein